MTWQDYHTVATLSAILTAAHERLDRAGAPPAPARVPWEQQRHALPERRITRRTPASHGTATLYRHGCRCDDCREWKRLSRKPAVKVTAWVSPVRVTRPTSAVSLACACGHEAHEVADLIRHTLATHGRPPTKAERTPQRRQEAA